ncbi:MAG: cysteine--tRNA ligase [Candidatus Muproteobacteria bacterium RBG_16_64_10]|uniref:Cysteine--tRNA ligase n=1 Tax=Candidatus Muproteobacteria bacterium RBG_16_64_10 TaxID=1817757 RepID=A0A1F6T3B3_9PROT|nr:MAG: cysteine--tRNA ligase [Candidatus Muproteobacteria bacterium RBG_16_64_10]
MLQIHNSLTKKKEPFTPLVPGKVKMYVCGMTVYDYCHVGHARVMVVFDMVTRTLRARGYDVTYIRNITDIDDKIIKRAHENKEDIGALTERFIAAMHEDERALGVLPPDAEPRATVYMPQIEKMIGTLVDRGLAYQAKNKDVYYRVRKFAHYGALSGKSLDDLQAGARVEIGEEKDDPLDFVLWKTAKSGEPQWNSPWGSGRPGWHIECSAMSTSCLGNHFDIHGGGMDLKFPHHENEIAQSEGATGGKFVNTWVHVGFVRVDQEKMSKSLGNFFTVREVLKAYEPEVLRYFILASHYRSPLDYSDENLKAAKSALDGLYIALRGIAPAAAAGDSEYAGRFHAAMDDDFNTPAALAVLFELAHALNKARAAEPARAAALAGELRALAGILGLLVRDSEQHLRGAGASDLGEAEIEALIAQRVEARRNRNWAESDRLRDELKARGILLEDVPGGKTVWRWQ